jgi:Tfp pilus assembly protein PilE
LAEEEKKRITLTELIIGLIIIFLLSVIVPGFFALQGRIKRAMTKGNLGIVRRGLEYYYHRNGSAYPETLDQLVPQYLGEVPKVDLGYLFRYNKTKETTHQLTDSGKWYYNSSTGEIYIDSFHRDDDNRVISEW